MLNRPSLAPQNAPDPYVNVHRPAQARPPQITARTALFLDFDGTLAAIAPRPDEVQVRDGMITVLSQLVQRQGGAVAVLTGRRLAQVDALLSPLQLPGAGVHGAELRSSAQVMPTMRAVDGLQPAIAALHALFDADERLLIEDKLAAVALHFRLAPERGIECVDAMRRVAASCGFELLLGNKVVEARMPDCNKGHALRSLMCEPVFAGRIPIAVGDDRTDEDAFAAAAAAGGYGVKIGTGPTCAGYRLPDVDAVHAWLHAALSG